MFIRSKVISIAKKKWPKVGEVYNIFASIGVFKSQNFFTNSSDFRKKNLFF